MEEQPEGPPEPPARTGVGEPSSPFPQTAPSSHSTGEAIRLAIRKSRRLPARIVGGVRALIRGIGSPSTGPKVTEVTAVFLTRDDNKDWDTELDIYVYDGRRSIVAQRARQMGEFGEGTNIPLKLDRFGVIAEEDIDSCSTTLVIVPNGNDTWRFDYEVDFSFEDGRAVGRKFFHKSLSEEKLTETYRLQEAIPVAPDPDHARDVPTFP